MEYRNVSDLTSLPTNPRAIRDKQFRALCESIRVNPRYFEARPLILSDRTGNLVVIAGNQRLEAARSIGLDLVPTHLIPHLSELQEREITIKDNAHLGEWDWEALANEWSDLPLSDWGLDIPIEWRSELQQSPALGTGNEKDANSQCPKCGYEWAS